jgi:[ribosomal protein S18]-alanine N-acetyltransferase
MIAPTLKLAGLGDAADIATMSQRYIEFGLRPAWTTQRVAGHIKDRESIVLKAVMNGSLIGFAIMQYGSDTAHLNLLAVEPGVRRLGIGRRLLDWLATTAIGAGTFTVHLELRARNEEARAFYEVLGYRESGRISGYYQQVEDAIRMSRDLRVRRDAEQPRG